VKVVAIVQARIGSTRLPAKVMLDLGGATALQRCLDRVSRFEGVTEVIVATTVRPEDELIVQLARRLGVRWSRGSSEDVLSRYIDAATEAKADVVVRCTSDCPLLDPALSSKVVEALVSSLTGPEPIDYASNRLVSRLPRGLDTEVITMDALERSGRECASLAVREHVTLHCYQHPERFRLRAVLPDFPEDYSSHRWTLDTLDDYHLLATLYDALGERASDASLADVLQVFAARPELKAINAHVPQKPVPSEAKA
jgi:spore coat polysaccharide biosynthesis protein SpsF